VRLNWVLPNGREAFAFVPKEDALVPTEMGWLPAPSSPLVPLPKLMEAVLLGADVETAELIAAVLALLAVPCPAAPCLACSLALVLAVADDSDNDNDERDGSRDRVFGRGCGKSDWLKSNP